tara:strand:+ start:20 stop:814 length:795 start_codon:yes stop_codon:yes gene_type:complete
MNKLINLTKKIRYSVCKMSHHASAAHLGSSLSCVDILVTIFFSGIFKFNQKKILLGDKFILSKGHAASALYSVLAHKNYFSKKQLLKYGKNNSYFEEHPNSKINGIICSTGSLGHGLSFGIGLAISDKLKKKKNKTVILMSDGECNEGTVWEAASFASAQNLSNIIVLIDHNKWQATGRTSEITGGNLIDKWLAFGWHTFDIDGNNVNALKNVLKKAKKSKKPVAIIANTIKGKGIHFMEDDNNWHYRIPSIEELNKIKILLNQ